MTHFWAEESFNHECIALEEAQMSYGTILSDLIEQLDQILEQLEKPKS